MSRFTLPALALFAIATVWGVTFTVTKETLAQIEPETFLFWRFLAAGFLLLIPAMWRRELTSPVLRAGSILGFLLFLGYWSQTRGLIDTSPSHSAFLTGLSVVMVPFLDRFLFKERLTIRAAAGAGLAMAGITVLFGGVASSAGRGEALTLFCALSFALHMIAAAHISRLHPPLGLAAVQVSLVALCTAPMLLVNSEPQWSSRVVAVVLGAAVINTAAAFGILMWAQARVSATQTAIILAFEPVAAALSSTFYYGEQAGIPLVAGGALIVTAMIVSQLPVSKIKTERTSA